MKKTDLLSLAKKHGTPLVIVDHDEIRRNYAVFRKHLPRVQCYFAVKANAEPAIVRTLYKAGTRASTWRIKIDDCVTISNHLSRLLSVENIYYGRLEVSSPGLDRALRKESDFIRFKEETINLKLRMPIEGQRNFIGILRAVNHGAIKLGVEGELLDFELSSLMKARLVPKL